jgi:hypothetical protein
VGGWGGGAAPPPAQHYVTAAVHISKSFSSNNIVITSEGNTGGNFDDRTWLSLGGFYTHSHGIVARPEDHYRSTVDNALK